MRQFSPIINWKWVLDRSQTAPFNWSNLLPLNNQTFPISFSFQVHSIITDNNTFMSLALNNESYFSTTNFSFIQSKWNYYIIALWSTQNMKFKKLTFSSKILYNKLADFKWQLLLSCQLSCKLTTIIIVSILHAIMLNSKLFQDFHRNILMNGPV